MPLPPGYWKLTPIARLGVSGIALVLTPVVSVAQPKGGGPGPVPGIVEIRKLFTINPQTSERDPHALRLVRRHRARP